MGAISEKHAVVVDIEVEASDALPDPCSMLGQLLTLPVSALQQAKRRQSSRPAGEIRTGGATEAVLNYLLRVPGFKTEAQIRFATGRSHAAVSWALLFLKGRGLVKAVPDVARNARYCRYCAAKGAGNAK